MHKGLNTTLQPPMLPYMQSPMCPDLSTVCVPNALLPPLPSHTVPPCDSCRFTVIRGAETTFAVASPRCARAARTPSTPNHATLDCFLLLRRLAAAQPLLSVTKMLLKNAGGAELQPGRRLASARCLHTWTPSPARLISARAAGDREMSSHIRKGGPTSGDLRRVKLQKIPGVGPKYADQLKEHNIYNLDDLMRVYMERHAGSSNETELYLKVGVRFRRGDRDLMQGGFWGAHALAWLVRRATMHVWHCGPPPPPLRLMVPLAAHPLLSLFAGKGGHQERRPADHDHGLPR